jgi:hypothetical protein
MPNRDSWPRARFVRVTAGGEHEWRRHRNRSISPASRSRAAMRLAKPGALNKPGRARVLKFMRLVCHEGFFAMLTQSFLENGSA